MDVFGSSDLDPAALTPLKDQDLDPAQVYALFIFIANLEGQLDVLKGEPLTLDDDSNSYWFLESNF